jgi:hypothetical protein
MANEEVIAGEFANAWLDNGIPNPEPDTSIYTDPEALGSQAGSEIDTALGESSKEE